MERRDIIVIGASSGGLSALKTVAAGLPADFRASVLVVWHMAPDARGVAVHALNRVSELPVAHAQDHAPILPGRIYVAPPDRHLLVEHGRMRVTRGPKENRFRPAVDPLFRSAAIAYGERVVGVVLTGALDDGTAGLWTIKSRGGLAVVQDPQDAEHPSMPESALRAVDVDHVVPISEMADLLGRLSEESVTVKERSVPDSERIDLEVRIAAEDTLPAPNIFGFAQPSRFSCPDCHGVMAELKDGRLLRYRCHTGHAYSRQSLLAAITDNIDAGLYDAMRAIDESAMLLNALGDHLAERGETDLAARYFREAQESERRAQLVRQVVTQHVHVSDDQLRRKPERQIGDVP